MTNMNSTHRTSGQRARGGKRRSVFVKAAALALAIATFAPVQQEASATDQTRRQAKRMFDRLVGAPPAPALLDELEQRVATHGGVAAALDVLHSTRPDPRHFHTPPLKTFATPWPNRHQ